MTLEPFPGAFRPGGPTVPQPVDGWHRQFLAAEEQSTAVLMGFYQDARLELEAFIREGDLSVSDAAFYRQLLDETNRIGSVLNEQGATWASNAIPEAYSAGWRTSSSIVVPQAALAALSKSTLALIRDTTLGIRLAIRQEIAKGILEGLSGDAVRGRILATGLTNIPHWPSVEYRAGVIARTETMTAYNTGIVSGIAATGATFVKWITSPDEAVCPICAPRSGKIFRLNAVELANDPYPDALPLPKLPAHPRCRCTVRGIYRDANGGLIDGRAPEVAPKLPTDAMGGDMAPILPLASGDFAAAAARLVTYGSSNAETWAVTRRLLNTTRAGMTDDELDNFLAIVRGTNPRIAINMAVFRNLEERLEVQFWRGLGQLNADEIKIIAGLKGPRGNDAWASFLQLRYGIAFDKPLGWSAGLREATLTALERLRAISPRFVVDSEYLKVLGTPPPGASRFGSNVIARAFPSGHVQGNMRLWETFLTRALRSGQATGAEEVILHEFMHTVHFRYGLYDAAVNRSTRFVHRAVEAIDETWHAEYLAIRRATANIVAPESIEALRIKEREFRHQFETLQEQFKNDPLRSSFGTSWKLRADQIAEQIAKIEAGAAELYPTEYARQEYAEDFAESGMMYLLNPERLRRYSPRRYAFFRDRVFGGYEA